MRWVNTITTFGLEIVLPAGAGYWLDSKLQTLPLFTVCGMIVGLVAATYHLVLALRSARKPDDED